MRAHLHRYNDIILCQSHLQGRWLCLNLPCRNMVNKEPITITQVFLYNLFEFSANGYDVFIKKECIDVYP